MCLCDAKTYQEKGNFLEKDYTYLLMATIKKTDSL